MSWNRVIAKRAVVWTAALSIVAGCGQQTIVEPIYSASHTAEKLAAATTNLNWPTVNWKEATPEKYGIDSAKLAAVIERASAYKVHSMVVVRGDAIVAEAYAKGFDENTLQKQYSIAKTVTGLAAGAAVGERLLPGADSLMSELLPKYAGAVKPDLKLKHVLSMTSGYRWINENEASSTAMTASSSWVRYVLGQPSEAPPGTGFTYSNGDAHLVSAVIQQATGRTLHEYASEKLFAPLGISKKRWDYDPEGYTVGAYALHLTARDMAKLGFLILHNGKWEGKQLVPVGWMNQTISPHASFKLTDGSRGGYGYLLWLSAIKKQNKSYSVLFAAGSGNQRIFIVPELDLVVTLTSAVDSAPDFPGQLLAQLVQEAVVSDKPLPESAVNKRKLDEVLELFHQ